MSHLSRLKSAFSSNSNNGSNNGNNSSNNISNPSNRKLIKMKSFSTIIDESFNSRFQHITSSLHTHREYVRIYLLSTIEGSRSNSLYITIDNPSINNKLRPWGMHFVDHKEKRLLIYDHFIADNRPSTEPTPSPTEVKQDYKSDIEDDEEEDIFLDQYLTMNMMTSRKKRRIFQQQQQPKEHQTWFKFSFKCLHSYSMAKNAKMVQFGNSEYQFQSSRHTMLIIPNISHKKALALDIKSGKLNLKYIPILIFVKHWLQDLQILSFENVLRFINDMLINYPELEKQLMNNLEVKEYLLQQLLEVKIVWNKYINDDILDSYNYYPRNMSWRSNIKLDEYEMRIKPREKEVKEDSVVNIQNMKRVLMRKFLLLFVLATKIDYHNIKMQQKNNKKNNNILHSYKRIFNCSLLYWFIRCLYFFQRASIPYILAVCTDEIDILGLNILWQAIQMNVKLCTTQYSYFLDLALFINFYDAIDCFRRNSNQKRSIQSPPNIFLLENIISDEEKTIANIAKYVFEMLEIDLALPVPSRRRFPVEGILLAKLTSVYKHQQLFLQLLEIVAKYVGQWPESEKFSFLTSFLQRYHTLISCIMDWEWNIHGSYYSFCEFMGVLEAGCAAQESNMVSKMKQMTVEQFNSFLAFGHKWKEDIFTQTITDVLLTNTKIEARELRKFLQSKKRKRAQTNHSLLPIFDDNSSPVNNTLINRSPSPIKSQVSSNNTNSTFLSYTGGVSHYKGMQSNAATIGSSYHIPLSIMNRSSSRSSAYGFSRKHLVQLQFRPSQISLMSNASQSQSHLSEDLFGSHENSPETKTDGGTPHGTLVDSNVVNDEFDQAVQPSVNSVVDREIKWFAKSMANAPSSDDMIIMVENYVRQKKEFLALHLLSYVLDSKAKNDVFYQMLILLSNSHFYRLPEIFQTFLDELLTNILWFPPQELCQMPPPSLSLPLPDVNHAYAHIHANTYTHHQLQPHSSHMRYRSDSYIARENDHNWTTAIHKPLPFYSPSNTIDVSAILPAPEDLLLNRDRSIPAVAMNNSLPSSPPFSPPSVNDDIPFIKTGSLSPKECKSPAIHESHSILIDAKYEAKEPDVDFEQKVNLSVIVVESYMDEEKDMNDKIGFLSATEEPSSSHLTPEPEKYIGESSLTQSFLAKNQRRVQFEGYIHVLTFDEKCQVLSWITDYVCNSIDINMFKFWDHILCMILNLPTPLNISNYDEINFLNVDQILLSIANKEVKNSDNQMSANENKMDIFVQYIKKECMLLHKNKSNMHKLMMFHNRCQMIFEELDVIFEFGLKCNDMLQNTFIHTIQGPEILNILSEEEENNDDDSVIIIVDNTEDENTDSRLASPKSSKSGKSPTSPKSADTILNALESKEFPFMTQTFRPWLYNISNLLYQQLHNKQILIKTIEYLNTKKSQLKALFDFTDIPYDDDIIATHKLSLEELHAVLLKYKYSSSTIKYKIKHLILSHWNLITIQQLNVLFSYLLQNNPTKPYNLHVVNRIGNVLYFDWNMDKSDTNTDDNEQQYQKYEISQQLCCKTSNVEHLDNDIQILGTYNMPPVMIHLNLRNLISIKDDGSKQRANACLLRVRAVSNHTNIQIKSDWSDTKLITIQNLHQISDNILLNVQRVSRCTSNSILSSISSSSSNTIQTQMSILQKINNFNKEEEKYNIPNKTIVNGEQQQSNVVFNINCGELQNMISSSFEYEQLEIHSLSSSLFTEIAQIRCFIKESQKKMERLQSKLNLVNEQQKNLPQIKDKCSSHLKALQNKNMNIIRTLEESVLRWTVDDCLQWFCNIGQCIFIKYYSILKQNLTQNIVGNIVNCDENGLQQLLKGHWNVNEIPVVVKNMMPFLLKLKQIASHQKMQLLFHQQMHDLRKQSHSRNAKLPLKKVMSYNKKVKAQSAVQPPHVQSHSQPNLQMVALSKNMKMIEKNVSSNKIKKRKKTKHRKRKYKQPNNVLNANVVNYGRGYSNTVNVPRYEYNANSTRKHTSISSMKTYSYGDSAINHQFGNSSILRSLLPVQMSYQPKHWQQQNMHLRHQQQQFQQQKVSKSAASSPSNKKKLKVKKNEMKPQSAKKYSNKNKKSGKKQSDFDFRSHATPMLASEEFYCPISSVIMSDPVLCEDGFSYERECIERWMNKNDISPMTSQPLVSKILLPAVELKQKIELWRINQR